MADLAELRERVLAATGPSAELNEAIAVAFGWCLHKNAESGGYNDDRGFSCPDCGADSWGNVGPSGQKYYAKAPPVTHSLDAVIALVEEKLPGWDWMRNSDGDMLLFPLEDDGEHEGHGATPALALLAALLSALSEPQP